MSVKMQDRELIYEGSVKKVWAFPEDADRLWFEYTDDYSVFDWGKMPDTIANKGRSLAIMGAFFFEELSKPDFWKSLPSSPHLVQFRKDWMQERWQHKLFSRLSKNGAPNHYKGLMADWEKPVSMADAAQSKRPVYLEVLPAEVVRPEPYTLIAQTVYYYPRKPSLAPRRLVPLEVVFRFGMPAGSSLKGRLEKDPGYARKLGLNKVPDQGEWFDRPVIEFFTKLEPKDRLLSMQEALLISGLNPEQFEELVELSYDLSLGLYELFAGKGIELWDGKFEFVIGKEGLLLADSIGPDELRLIYKGCHLSKEMIRQVYRGSAWEKSVKEAQEIASTSGKHDWKEVCRVQLKQEPAALPADFKNTVDKLYGAVTNHLAGKTIFAEHPSLDEFVEMTKKVSARS